MYPDILDGPPPANHHPRARVKAVELASHAQQQSSSLATWENALVGREAQVAAREAAVAVREMTVAGREARMNLSAAPAPCPPQPAAVAAGPAALALRLPPAHGAPQAVAVLPRSVAPPAATVAAYDDNTMDAPDDDTLFLYYYSDLYADFVDFTACGGDLAVARARKLVEGRATLGYGGHIGRGGSAAAPAAAMDTIARRGDDYTDYYDSD